MLISGLLPLRCVSGPAQMTCLVPAGESLLLPDWFGADLAVSDASPWPLPTSLSLRISLRIPLHSAALCARCIRLRFPGYRHIP